jgi:hypothetical protein
MMSARGHQPGSQIKLPYLVVLVTFSWYHLFPAEEQQQSAFSEENKQAIELIRRRKSKMTFLDVFQMDWSAAGHPEIPVYDKEAAETNWTTKVGDMVGLPYAIKLESAKKLVHEDPVLSKSIKGYLHQFPKTKKAISEDKVAAPLHVSHGADSLKPVWLEAFKQEHTLKDQLNRLSSVALKPWIFGYTSTCCHMDFEPEFLGTMRCYCTGKVKVLLVSAHSLVQNGIATAKDGEEQLNEIIGKYFMGLKTIEAIKKLSEVGVKVHHLTLDGDDAPILVTPPGWFQMTCVVQDSDVVGIRVSHLPKAASAKLNLQSCTSTEEDRKSIEPWVSLLDVHLKKAP